MFRQFQGSAPQDWPPPLAFNDCLQANILGVVGKIDWGLPEDLGLRHGRAYKPPHSKVAGFLAQGVLSSARPSQLRCGS